MTVVSTLPCAPLARAVPLLCLIGGVLLGAHLAGARERPAVTPLLATSQTVMGERIAYPAARRIHFPAASPQALPHLSAGSPPAGVTPYTL